MPELREGHRPLLDEELVVSVMELTMQHPHTHLWVTMTQVMAEV